LEYMEDIPEAGVALEIAEYPIEIVEIKDNKVAQAKIYPPLEDDEDS
jgi:Mg2+/Co2+ transporter CorB